MFYVISAIPPAFQSLTTFKNGSLNKVIIDRQACQLADTLCNLLTLVIAALSKSLFSKRYRYNSIDFIEKMVSQE